MTVLEQGGTFVLKSILSVFSHADNIETVVSTFRRELHDQPSLVFFFSSTKYDFLELSKQMTLAFQGSEVIGVTTVGEIGPKGFESTGVSAMSFDQQFKVAAVLMDDIEKFPIFSRKKLITAAKNIGISLSSKNMEREGIALIFPNGLVAGEEKMLSIVNSIFEHDGFPIFGGTAGDDAKFKETSISVNGKVSSKGGAVALMKTNIDIHIHKENIFQTTGRVMEITKVNTEERIVYEMNGKRAASEYARLLGVSESQLPNYFMKSPLGRKVNEDIYIASPFQVLKDGSIQFYCQIFQHQKVDILEPIDPITTLNKSVLALKNEFRQLDGVLAINCILRKLQFEQEHLISALNKEFETLPSLAGFCSYGEQINNTQLNQTLVLLGFGNK